MPSNTIHACQYIIFRSHLDGRVVFYPCSSVNKDHRVAILPGATSVRPLTEASPRSFFYALVEGELLHHQGTLLVFHHIPNPC